MADHFLDSSVLLLAVGGAHPQREPCRRYLEERRRDGTRLHASVETVQEFLFHRMRRESRREALARTRTLGDALVLHALDDEVWADALDLVERAEVRGRDAIIAVTALRAGFTEIVSLDRDFDRVPGLTRVDPS